MRLILLLVCLILQLSSLILRGDSLPILSWDIPVNRPISYTLPLYRGESVHIRPRFVQGSSAISLPGGSVAVLKYRDYGMQETSWYAVTGTVWSATNGQVDVLWTPSAEGASNLYVFTIAVSVTAGDITRCGGILTLSPTVGTSSTGLVTVVGGDPSNFVQRTTYDAHVSATLAEGAHGGELDTIALTNAAAHAALALSGGAHGGELDPRWSSVSNVVLSVTGRAAIAHAWGNHATNGYLTADTMPLLDAYMTNGTPQFWMSAYLVTGVDLVPDCSGYYYPRALLAAGQVTNVWFEHESGGFAIWSAWSNTYQFAGTFIGQIDALGLDCNAASPGMPTWQQLGVKLDGEYTPGGYGLPPGSGLGEGTAFVTRIATTITLARATSGSGLVISVGGNIMVHSTDPRVTGAVTNEADPKWSAVSNAVAISTGRAATAFSWGNHATNNYLTTAASRVTRYMARSTSGNEVWVLASQTGVTATVVGSGITIVNPVNATIHGISVRWNGSTLGTSFTLDAGTNDWANTALGNRFAPTMIAYREDTGAQVNTASITLNTSDQKQITVGSLISTCINRVDLRP